MLSVAAALDGADHAGCAELHRSVDAEEMHRALEGDLVAQAEVGYAGMRAHSAVIADFLDRHEVGSALLDDLREHLPVRRSSGVSHGQSATVIDVPELAVQTLPGGYV